MTRDAVDLSGQGVGPKTGITDFEHYAKKHRAQTAAHIVGTEVTDHPSEGQLVAMARKYFLKYDRMAGTGPSWKGVSR